MNTELNRGSSIRKSIRFSKRMAPAPPQRQVAIDIDGNDEPDSTIKTATISPFTMNATKSPPPTVMPRKLLGTSPSSAVYAATDNGFKENSLIHDKPVVPVSKYNPQYRVEIKDKFNLKLSDITPDFEESATPTSELNPKLTTSKAKTDFFNSGDDSSKALNSLQSAINSVILNTTLSAAQTPTDNNNSIMSPKMYKKISTRYGEQSNLLNTGISDVASGHGLAYDSSQDDVNQKPIEFKRGVDGRNSTGGVVAFTSKFLSSRPKPPKPVARTSSDTKNIELTVLKMRAKIKERDMETKKMEKQKPEINDLKKQQLQQQQQHRDINMQQETQLRYQKDCPTTPSRSVETDHNDESNRQYTKQQVPLKPNHDMKVLFKNYS